MGLGDLLIIKGGEVEALLAGREREIIETVGRAYVTHAEGLSSLPHSLFLRFPEQPRDRIIALPAYLGGEFRVAGIKWISSFPGNVARGMDRASAIVVLNSTETGQPEALIEGSRISAKRTAASAALAASRLSPAGGYGDTASLVGAGVINFEVARFLQIALPELKRLLVFDLDAERVRHFAERCADAFQGVSVEVVGDVNAALSGSPLVSLATTALSPHIADLGACAPGTTVLHVSLRDLAPGVILAADNVVDDVDHVCRAETSVHLAEQAVGHREFIRCTLADILRGTASARDSERTVSVFSPFGLGILDLAVSELVFREALGRGMGTTVNSFLA